MAEAIYEHYLPTHAGGELPAGIAGSLVSIADKLDTVVGCFGVGQIPTGTADPFALRRQALGIIRIILAKNLPLSLADLTEKALEGLNGKRTEPKEQTYHAVMDFFKRRLQHFLVGQGYQQSVVDAVLVYDLDPLVETVAKIRALEAFKERKEFEPLLGTVKRVVNILKEPVDETVDPNTFVNSAETDLYRQLTACEQDLKEALAVRDYNAALERLSQLKDSIDRFFEEVLVLDENLSLRQNRLALLTRIAGLFQQVADFSRIVP